MSENEDSSGFTNSDFSPEFSETAVRLTGQDFPDLALKSIDELVQDVREIGIEELSLRELVSLRKAESPLVLIDLREPDERTSGNKIRGALNIPRGILEMSIHKHVKDPNSLIVIFCSDGNRSVLSAESLMRMGYRNVRVLSGGFKQVKKSMKKSRPDSTIS